MSGHGMAIVESEINFFGLACRRACGGGGASMLVIIVAGICINPCADAIPAVLCLSYVGVPIKIYPARCQGLHDRPEPGSIMWYRLMWILYARACHPALRWYGYRPDH